MSIRRTTGRTTVTWRCSRRRGASGTFTAAEDLGAVGLGDRGIGQHAERDAGVESGEVRAEDDPVRADLGDRFFHLSLVGAAGERLEEQVELAGGEGQALRKGVAAGVGDD